MDNDELLALREEAELMEKLKGDQYGFDVSFSHQSEPGEEWTVLLYDRSTYFYASTRLEALRAAVEAME